MVVTHSELARGIGVTGPRGDARSTGPYQIFATTPVDVVPTHRIPIERESAELQVGSPP